MSMLAFILFFSQLYRIGVDFVRRGAFTSMVLVELVWTFILWVLWLAAAALAAQEQQFVFGVSRSCDFANSRFLSIRV